VLINGRPLSIRWTVDHVPGIVEAWMCGEQGGNAVADVLSVILIRAVNYQLLFPAIRDSCLLIITTFHRSMGRVILIWPAPLSIISDMD